MTIEEELKIYKKAVMDLVETIGFGPKSLVRFSKRPCKFVWTVHGDNPCDIRRYAYSHADAVAMVSNKTAKGWTLYRLVKVRKRK